MLNHFDSNQGLLFLIKKKKTKTQEKSLPKYRNENKSFVDILNKSMRKCIVRQYAYVVYSRLKCYAIRNSLSVEPKIPKKVAWGNRPKGLDVTNSDVQTLHLIFVAF